MKRVNNLYRSICDLDNIIEMTNIVCKNTKNKKKVEKFETYKMEHIINIKNKLESKDFQFDKYNIFMISDPKVRIIMNQTIEDKIINHLVAKYILIKVFEPKFTNSMIATRKNYGISYGIKILKKYLNKLRNKNFYILKLDIKKYFYNIDHKVLEDIINKHIKDKDSLNILYKIINTTNQEYINKEIIKLKNNKISNIKDENVINEIEEIPLYKKGKGCNIGSNCSQIFGLIYLLEINHYIKEKIKIRYVINYMDDFIILHESKEYLKYCLEEIKIKLKEYKLELNMKKTKIDNIKNGIDFIGYRFYIKDNKIIMKLRNRTKKKLKKKVKSIKLLRDNNLIDNKTYYKLISSYKGLSKYCNNLYRNTIHN